MKRVLFALFWVAAFASPLKVAFAYPPCGPFQAPNQPSSFCRYDVPVNDYQRVSHGLAFVWIRNTPSSSAPAMYTVYPSTAASMVTVGGAAQWDGYQWWWEVRVYPNGGIQGWVEQASLAQVLPLIATPSIEPTVDTSIAILANWTPPFTARVERGLSFLWVRREPNSADVVYTLPANTQFQVVNTNPPAFDGYQWWWYIEARTPTRFVRGWVEQGSITPSS